MSRSSADREWGSFTIGDLTDAVRRAGELLGTGLEPARVTVTPPKAVDDLPRVAVVVEDQRSVFRLRSELKKSEHLPRFVGRSSGSCWTAEVDGIELTVSLAEEALW